MKSKSLVEKFLLVGVVFCLAVFILASAQAQTKIPTPKLTPKYGGTLRIGYALDADNIGDPVARPMSSTGVRIGVTAVETLLHYDEKGMPVPWLATDWKVSKNLRSITFTLRKGVKFHDGTNFNAEAVKWNIDRYRTSSNVELKAVASVDVLDDSTVRLNLSTWSNTLLDSLTMHAGMMISPTAYQKNGGDWCRKNAVGTGPFKFVSWQLESRLRFEKFNGYWQKGKPYLDAIEWVIISDMMTRTAAFKRGEVNVFPNLEPQDVKELEKEDKYYFSTGGLTGLNYSLAGDSGHPNSPFANVRVRQAIEHAIDKQTLVDALTYGYGKVCNQYAYPGSWGVNPDVKGYPYNPDRARRLLAEAGYPNGFKTTLYTPGWGFYVYPPPAIQEYLKKVGITLEIEVVDQGRHQTILRSGWRDGLIFPQTTMSLPDAAINLAARASCQSYLKGSIMCADDYEAVLVKALAAPDFETKKKLTWEAQKLLIDKYAIINFFYTQARINSFYKNVHDTGIGETIDTQWTPEDAWIGSMD
jgi:ABC-type transport system substrate-binding protein